MEATGATTHVCMWLDPSTKKPCGHSFCLKPKVTKASSARIYFTRSTYENMPSGASEDIASAFKVTLTKRGIDLRDVHSAVSDLAAMSVTVAMGLDASPCQMHNLARSPKPVWARSSRRMAAALWWTRSPT
jgi:hypothetical protein